MTHATVSSPVSTQTCSTRHAANALSAQQLKRLHQALAPLHEAYNPEQRALCQPFSSPGYHTTLTGGMVHRTRESMTYAVALLETGEDRYCQRAIDIIHRIVPEQDQDPHSNTYGIWSWFLEEPLTQMSPPDWNWADFLGARLLQIAIDHRHRLDAATAEMVDTAIVHAARSIMRRNIGPHYTNISIMGSYVTLVAGELYNIAELRDYAVARFRRFHDYTFHHGGFTEFNSPTYTRVAIEELGRLRMQARHPEVKAMVEALYRRGWEEVAHHFHPPTRQWAGPHSRSYRTLLADEFLAFIERWVPAPLNWGFVDRFPGIEEAHLPLPCPDDLASFFVALPGPRMERKTLFQDTPPVIASTYLHPDFALGSINRGDLWNQRRSLVGYWGKPDQPSALHLRFLLDDHDFPAAQFFSVQDRENVLAGVAFATNGGVTHLVFDPMTNGQFRARKLRLRFEISGPAARSTVDMLPDPYATVCFLSEALRIELTLVAAKLSGQTPRWQVERDNDALGIDVVLYDGPAQLFSLPDMEAAVGVSVRIVPADASACKQAVAHYDADRLLLSWKNLQLAFPTQPSTIDILQHRMEAKVDVV